MPSEMVGSAYARISLDKSDFDSGLDSAHGKFSSVLGSMEGKAASVGKTIGSALIVGTVAAGAALVGVATVGTKSFMDIESAAADAASKMDLGAIAQKSGKTIEESFLSVKEHVIAVSRELGQLNTNAFDPTQIADALANLAAGGFDVATASAKNLTPILSLATATNYDLDKSASMAMATMNQYGLSIGDLGEISDVFTQACGDSALGMEDLQYALSYAGPVAKAAGVSLNETVAALEVFSQSGIKGEKAGTALVDVMNTLVAPTGAASKALAGIGVNLKDVDPRTHDFADVLSTLKQKADASGDGLKAFTEIFGVRGGLIYGLAGATKELETFETKLDSSGGAAERMAKLMLDTLGGSFDAAKGAAIDLAIGLGQDLAPALKGILDWFSSTGAPGIRAFYEALKKGDWKSIGTTMSNGIKAGWDKLKDLGKQLYDKIRGVNWRGLGSYIVGGIKTAWAELSSLGGQLLGWLQGVNWSEIGTKLANSVSGAVIGLGTTIYNGFKNIDWSGIVTLITGALSGLATYYSTLAKNLYDAIVGIDWGSIGSKVLASLGNVASQITSLFSGIDFGKIWDNISSGADTASKTITTAFNNAISNLSGIGKKVFDYLNSQNWNGIGQTIGKAINSGVDLLKDIGGRIAGFISSHSWSTEGSTLANKIKGGIGTIKGWADDIVKGIKDTVKWDAIGKDLGNFIKDGLASIKNYHDAILSSIKSWLSGGGAKNLGSEIGTMLANGIKSMIDVGAWFVDSLKNKGGGNAIIGAFRTAIDWLMIGTTAVADFTSGFIQGFGTLAAYIAAQIQNSVLEGVAGMYDALPYGVGGDTGDKLRSRKVAVPEWSAAPQWNPSENDVERSRGQGGWSTPSVPSEITGQRGSTGNLVSLGSGMSTKITLGYGTGGTREEVGIKEWVKQQAENGVEWTDLKAELNKLGDGRALAKSDLSFLQTVYDDAIKTQTSTADTQIKAAEKAADITVEAAEEAKDTTEDAAKDSADTTTKAAEESAETSKKTTEWAASKWTGLADVMSYAAQTASSSISTTATSAANTLTAAAQNSLTIGNAIASKMQGAGDAVKIGLDAAGRQIAVIGQVAQSQFAAAGGQFVGSATQAGTITTGAATRASGLIQGVTSGFSQAGSTVSNGLNAGANALQGAAGAVTSAANAMKSGSDWVRNLPTTYQTTGVSKTPTKSSYPTWMTDAVPWLAEGKETSGPELAVIGEEGKEFVIPTKKKRWDLLLAAMKAYGIRGMADGGAAGSTGSSTGDADQMQAYFGITGLASMSKSVQKIINDLKDFFRISWAIIKAEGSTYWKAINAIITAEATTTRNNAWQAALDIRNTWLSSNQQIVADATTTYAAMWPAIEPGVKSIHDGIIYSFQDSGSQVKALMDQMGSDAMISLTSFQTSWNTVWQQMLADLQSTASQITGILTDLGAKVGSITVNASVNVSGGGAGSYGGSANMTGSGGGGGSGGSNGAIINTNGTANFTDTTCTGDLVLVNALKYTNPNGQVSYINPLTYLETGGISNYQSSGYGGSGGITPSSSGAGYSGGMATAYGSGFSWGAEGAYIDKHSVVHVGEKGPELILPAKLTRMFLNLAEGGSTGPGQARPIVIEDHTSHHWYLDGKEVTNQIMERATKQLRLKGAISTR